MSHHGRCPDCGGKLHRKNGRLQCLRGTCPVCKKLYANLDAHLLHGPHSTAEIQEAVQAQRSPREVAG